MTRSKFTIGSLLAIILLVSQVLVVQAAPARQDTTPITGNVDSVVLNTDPTTGDIIVAVTVTDTSGVSQTVNLSVETATTLGLVTTDGTGAVIVNDAAINTQVEIDPSTVLPTAEGTVTEEPQHPVGSALANFFSGLLGVDYGTIMEYHDQGTGFGVIAQALWMTNALGGDTVTFTEILDAKQSHDYGAITLPDGSTPQNWGQFRKAVMSNRDKAKENLGAIMSGRADAQSGGTTQMGTETNDAPGNSGNHGNNGNHGNSGNANGHNKNKNK